MKDNTHVRHAGLTIALEDIAEIRSHEHVIAQCLDVVLGAMSFRLNNKHKEIPAGERRRGKRTIAKEKLYNSILQQIHKIKPRLNIGVSTSANLEERWTAPYLHWSFKPSETEYRNEFVKPKKKSGPTQPT